MESGNGNENGMVPVEGDSNLVGAGPSADTEATQAVQVALNIRPLIALERAQGCKDCISVVPGEPQVLCLPSLLTIVVDSLCFEDVKLCIPLPLRAIRTYNACVLSLSLALTHSFEFLCILCCSYIDQQFS